MKNVIDFLRERGTDDETLRMIEAKCNESKKTEDSTSEDEAVKTKKPKKRASKKKQPKTQCSVISPYCKG